MDEKVTFFRASGFVGAWVMYLELTSVSWTILHDCVPGEPQRSWRLVSFPGFEPPRNWRTDLIGIVADGGDDSGRRHGGAFGWPAAIHFP